MDADLLRDPGLRAVLGRVRTADDACAREAATRHDALAKPPGSLGHLEDLGGRLCAIAGRCPPPEPVRPVLVVAAGDHGCAVHTSMWPSEITAAMVPVIADGRSAAGVLAQVTGVSVRVLDVGVAGAVPPHPAVIAARVADGTRDFTSGPAMTVDQAEAAITAGLAAARGLLAEGCDLLLTGDMGIGNTAPAAALIAVFTGRDVEDVTGPGAGADADRRRAKVAALRTAMHRHRPSPTDPVAALAAVGGLEHAALVGVMLAGAVAGVPVLLDGVNTDAAALVACALHPGVAGHLIAGHRSTEPGATAALEHLGLTPVVDLAMRLGEGTGALLAVPVVRAAARVMRDMATLAELGGA